MGKKGGKEETSSRAMPPKRARDVTEDQQQEQEQEQEEDVSSSHRAAVNGSSSSSSNVTWRDVLRTAAALLKARPLQPPPASAASSSSTGGGGGVVPSFRVGTLEMYKRFPEAYDAFMACHNCDAIDAILQKVCGELLGPVMSTTNEDGERIGGGRRERILRVCDLGCGTGRIGSMLLRKENPFAQFIRHVSCYDKEVNMLKVCHRNLTPIVAAHAVAVVVEDASSSSSSSTTGKEQEGQEEGDVISMCFRPFDFEHVRSGALTADSPPYSLITSAWALSYVVREQWGGSKWHAGVRGVIEACVRALDPARPSALVFAETLGTGAESPTRQCLLFDFIESMVSGGAIAPGRPVTCTREWVRTDYTFPSAEEAVGMCRFFFGPRVADQVALSGSKVLAECTAVLIIRVAQAS